MTIHYAARIEFTPAQPAGAGPAPNRYYSPCGVNGTDARQYTKANGKADKVTCAACVRKITGAMLERTMK